MISSLGTLLAVVGVVLLVVGYITAPAAIRPGWVCLGVGIALILISYLVVTVP